TAISADQSLMIFVGNDLAAVEATFSAAINPGPPTETTSPDSMINSYNDMLEQGIEIDDNLWHELDSLVARVLVESTESSRAGAGD
ncbi:MAG: hypothetical protein ACPH4D_06960, partial [Porticoccaceae bacterium]